MTDAAHDRSLYRCMSTIRQFETTVRALVESNEIAGVTHEYIGQEAVAAGVCAALRPDDWVTSTHRGHGHSIAKGADLAGMFAELLGRTTGLNGGRGGSMHVASLADGVLGANGIVGAGIPFALGAAWGGRRRGTDQVAVAFFGDGGANQGILFECMNLAAIWALPVLFVCENNHFAVSLRAEDAIAGDLARRAEAFGLTAHRADGMDARETLRVSRAAVDGVRKGAPEFVEFDTYRFVGHHTAEQTAGMNYRTEEEIDTWRLRDPLVRLERELGGPTAASIRAEVETALAVALETARGGPQPDPATALDHMYASTVTPAGSPR